jgi:hypothetical protein
MISLIIPTNGTNQEYTDNLIRNIRDLYPNKDKVEIVLSADSIKSLGSNYNNAVAKAKGDKIILLHNDMVISRGFIETMGNHIQKGRITTYTRIEPPIYNDTYPGKVIMDCGSDIENFNQDLFNSIYMEELLIDGGSQLFFGCMKEDYIGIDGYTFKMFCEDDDLHLRYKLLGFEKKVSSAYVYHFVSKTSRTTKDSQHIEFSSNRNFIRKWGSRSPVVKYNIGFIVKHCNLAILEALEPWCDNIYIEDTMQVLTSHYIDKEQKNTKFNLDEKIKMFDDEKNNDILVKFDYLDFNPETWENLQLLPEIIHDSGEIGQFELGILKIDIQCINEMQNNLIYLKNI